jgi:2-succinyl-6-hydroxy-2,4-cyclohexadiene-1-carboxylate synthase
VWGNGAPLVLSHGFTQNAGAWGPFADRLAEHHRVTAVDLPGHGGSTSVSADLWETAGLLAERGRADYLGYSLGGRVCLHLALARPELVRRLVLIGANPGIEDDGARAERRRRDDALAAGLHRSGAPVAGDEQGRLDDFLSRWLAGPLFATLSTDAAQLPARQMNTCAGLADSLRHCGTGRQKPLWARLGELEMPVLLVVGEHDRTYSDVARRAVSMIGGPTAVEVVAGAGHACHLERPDDVAVAVEGFLG